MTGYIINNAMPAKNDLWLLKTDSLGNTCEIDTNTWEGCEDPVTVVEIPGNGAVGSVFVYPNPAPRPDHRKLRAGKPGRLCFV